MLSTRRDEHHSWERVRTDGGRWVPDYVPNFNISDSDMIILVESGVRSTDIPLTTSPPHFLSITQHFCLSNHLAHVHSTRTVGKQVRKAK